MQGQQAKQLDFKVLFTLPHSTENFTQGLIYEAPYLYESTGLYSKSKLIKYRLNSQSIEKVKELALPKNIFAEGISIHEDSIVMLSYKQQKAWVFDKETFQQLKQFAYKGEGWGLTSGLGKYVMSNGSDKLLFRSKNDFSLKHQLPIKFKGQAVSKLNELDWYKGLVVANIWYDNRLIFINPFSGQVVYYIDLTALMQQYAKDVGKGNVANGVAYNLEDDTLYVTGKNWAKIFAIRLKLN